MTIHKKIYDVIVVGAGPSGLNASRLIAQRGYSVLVLEAKKEVGKDVICTGVLGKQVLERFSFPVVDSIVNEIQKVKIVSPYGTELFYTHPSPFAVVVDREKFDKSLFESALAAEVEIALSYRVKDALVLENNYVQVYGESGESKGEITYRGRVLILATGVEYGLSRRLGLGCPVRYVKAAQKYIRYDGHEDVTLVIGNKIARGGFGWIVPVPGRKARAGLMTEGDPETGFKHMMETFPEIDGQTGLQFKPIAQGIVSKTFRERVLAVGEAAGQVKTTTGGGVCFGLLCAEIAATVVDNSFKDDDFSEYRFSSYEEQWKSQIGNEIRLGTIARTLCGKLSDQQIERIFGLLQTDGFFDFIARNADFDWHGNFLMKFLKMLLGPDIAKR